MAAYDNNWIQLPYIGIPIKLIITLMFTMHILGNICFKNLTYNGEFLHWYAYCCDNFFSLQKKVESGFAQSN